MLSSTQQQLALHIWPAVVVLSGQPYFGQPYLDAQQFCKAKQHENRTAVKFALHLLFEAIFVNAGSFLCIPDNISDSPFEELKLAHLLPDTALKVMRE